MSILDKIPSLAGNELFQKLAVIEDITALCKEDQEKYDDAIKVMRDYIAAYKGAIIEAKIEVAKNMLIHIHTQNLYPATHRPPADIRLHNRCWASA